MSGSSTPQSTATDAESRQLIDIIRRSNKDPTDDQLQQEAIQATVNFIHAHDIEVHMFCNRVMYPASIHALILFSFDQDSNPALDWFKEKVATALDSCPKCITLFHRGRVRLKDTFITERGVSADQVELFSEMILKWEATRLTERLTSFIATYTAAKETDPKTPVPTDLLKSVAECLSGPNMLRLNAELRQLFDQALLLLLKREHPFVTKANALTPGLLFLMFEGTDVQKKWAFRMLDQLYQPCSLLQPNHIHHDIMEEYEIQLRIVQHGQSKAVDEDSREKFYRCIYPFLKLLDGSTMIERIAHFATNRPVDLIDDDTEPLVYSIFHLLRDDIMSYPDHSLPYILRVLALSLERIGTKFWNEIGEFTFQNIMGCIIANPNFVKSLVMLRNTSATVGEVSPPARISDLFVWIDPFLSTLNVSQKLKSVETLSMRFINQLENEESISLEVKSVLFTNACKLLSGVLSIPGQLYTTSLTTDLLARSDARVVVNTKLLRFIDYATADAIFFPEELKEKNGEIGKVAINVLCMALRFDILTFAQNSYEIHRGHSPSTLKFSPSLFQAILRQNFQRQLELSFQVLCSMENVSTILPVGSKSQASEISEFLGYISRFFIKFGDVDPKNAKMILSNSRSLKGYWACVFSPDENVYQSAVDILYETFDATGRLEGVQSLLSNNMEACIQAINENLTNLIFIEFFEPCPRAVKVLTDIIQALNSPVDGLFAEHEKFSPTTRKVLVTFWNRCWRFLNLIYKKTIQWADKYPDLVEFTRDTLDLSHAVLGCFRTVKDVFEAGDSISIFNEITSTFEDMLVWLRLSDPGLLASCVQLISSTVDLATDLNYRLDTNLVKLLASYGSKAKKFNNKLTETQSEEILERARLFDSDLVDKIVEEAESNRRIKLRDTSAATSRSATPGFPSSKPPLSSSSSTAYSSKTSAPPPRQMKVDNFTSLKSIPTFQPGYVKPKVPKSAAEQAREKLQAKRAAALIPGKRKDQKTDDNDDDDDDDDDDDAYSLFNIKKPASKSINLLGDWNKTKKKSVDDKKREEEYSRLRLNVDMKPLYRKILMWSFTRDDEYPDSELNKLVPVSDEFKNATEYEKIYEPLLLVECWQSLCAARSREDFKPMYITVGSKSTVGDFFEVFFSMSKSELSEKGVTESDLVVLALAEKIVDNPTARDVKNSKMTCLAKVHSIKYVKGDKVDLNLRVTRSASLNQWLNPSSPILMMRVMQMTTLEREFSSLFGLRYYNLADQILKAKPNEAAKVPESVVKTLESTYQVNHSQAIAIGASVLTEGFSLIQGPPGTGKTKTILGIIGHMLSTFRASNAITVPQGQSLPSATSVPKTKKVLVCAPSNAAVDELVLRLKDGVMNSKGEKYTPKIVRLGRSEAVNSAVKDVTLEELVDNQLGNSAPVASNTDTLFKELNAFREELDECKKLIANEKNPAGKEVHDKRRILVGQINNVKKKLDEERERQNSNYRNREITRRNCQAKILGEAEIICSTLSGSAHDMVANLGIKFDSVIIDEACQCTELSAVIPLRYGCRRCIMVGDPNQLPPTVLSSAAADSKYDQSLFVRMAKNVKPILLNVQYRMNSAISKFPSKKFYDGELKDGPKNDSLTTRPWHNDPLLPPYRFFDIIQGQQSQNKKTFSFTNRAEVDIAMELVHKLFTKFNKIDFRGKIGVITPYKEQNNLLRSTFMREFGKSIMSEISFNTIDGFQGQEKEIIIMSCVRADPASRGVGFLRDFRRMNVALTRPKCSLWILGHHDSLVKNQLWGDLISDAKERSCFAEAKRGFTRETKQGGTSSRNATANGASASSTKNLNLPKGPARSLVPTAANGDPRKGAISSTVTPPVSQQSSASSSQSLKPAPASQPVTQGYVSRSNREAGILPPSQASATAYPPRKEPSRVGVAHRGNNTVSDPRLKVTTAYAVPLGARANQYRVPKSDSVSTDSLEPLPSRSTLVEIPNGPATTNLARSGTLQQPQSQSSGILPHPQPLTSGTLPPRPTSSGTIPKKRLPKKPADIFIKRRRR